MANISACLSSDSTEWATPNKLFQELNEEFHFTLDPCSTDENAKCELHFTKRENGLIQDWGGNPYFAIRLTDAQSRIGSKSVSTNHAKTTRSLLC